MKKIILTSVLVAGLVATQVQPAKAGGWPIAAAAVGGLAVGTAVGATIAASQPVYYYPQQTVYTSTVAPAPTYAPSYVQNAPAVPNAPLMNDAPVQAQAYAPQVVYSQPAPTVVYSYPSYPAYYSAPVIGVGFGLGLPYWGWGGYRGYYGHGYYGRGGYYGGGHYHR